MSNPALTTIDWAHADLWGPPSARRPFGPRDILWALAALVLVNVAAAAPAFVAMARDPSADLTRFTQSPAILGGGELGLWIVLAATPMIATRWHGARSLRVDFGWALTRSDVWLGLEAGLVLRAIDQGLSAAAAHLPLGQDADNAAWLFQPRPWLWQTGFLLGAAVIAPVCEELFFRGFVLRSLTRLKRPSPRARTVIAVVGSSALFGALHTTGATLGGLYVAVVTGCLGAVLALFAVRTGRLGAGIVAHVVFNSTAVLLAYLMG